VGSRERKKQRKERFAAETQRKSGTDKRDRGMKREAKKDVKNDAREDEEREPA
jgi:hypothetical protein